jgi:DNA gyrase subunit A
MNEENIHNINIEDTLKKSYLDYSMSVIIGRALPNARDGLKPVHRRILVSMNDLNITSKSAYKKSARIIGDTIGKYHPHGDKSVYDALVRMSQDFSMRNPLIDGQGNFGSIDGDNAAAMRYTEARISPITEYILRDLEKDTVDFRPTYDDSGIEPEILPCAVPNLLINGSEGIAVGMATKIPPHNLNEICDGVVHVIENKDATIDDLLPIIQGPDFPTSGVIHGKEGILEAYRTGRGRIKIRAKMHIEALKNDRELIIIDEIPYQVNKSNLITKIAELARAKDKDIFHDITNISDESDKSEIRIVIELKRGAITDIIMNNLFKHTSLEVTFGIILLAVDNGEPKVFTLMDLIHVFIKHRKTIIIRKTIYELEKAKSKAHLLEGLQIAIDDIDTIINIVKASADKASACDELILKYELSDRQASAILEMRLARLTGLEKQKILDELKELYAEIKKLSSVLKDENKLNKIIIKETKEIKEKFGTDRKTDIEENYDALDMEDLIPNDSMVVSITHKGYIKRVNSSVYKNQKRGGKGKIALTLHDDDFIENFFSCHAHDTLMIVTESGQLHWLKVYRIPEASRNAIGKNIVNLISISEKDKIKSIISTNDFSEKKALIFFTRKGIIKKTNLKEFSNIRKNGVRSITLKDGDAIVTAKISDESTKTIMIFTKQAQCIQFYLDDCREQGRSTQGVKGIIFKKEDDIVVDATVVGGDPEILTVGINGVGKRTKTTAYKIQKRGGKGVIAMKLTKKTGSSMIGIVNVEEKSDLMVLTESGKLIRVDMATIASSSRNASGVHIIKGDKVSSISVCPKITDLEDIDDDEE